MLNDKCHQVGGQPLSRKNNKISIIIPTYNSAQTLAKCLEHIFKQTYKNIEIIIVNDGSIDNTQQVLKKYQDKLKIINQPNQGAPAARNRGFRESKGEYLLFVDADVYLKPNCVLKMYQTLQQNPKAAYAYSSFKWGWKKFKLWEFNAEKLKQMPYIHTCSLIRRESFPKYGFDESLKRFQDWDLWLTMLESNHHGTWIPEILFTTSTKKNTMSSWIPAFIYNHFPWIDKKRIKAYNNAKNIILKKHHL